MGRRWGRCDFREMREFRDRLEDMDSRGAELDALFEACAKELAARLLALVIKRTPVGQYPKSSGKKGGTLRRGWTGGQSGDAKAYAEGLDVRRAGNVYTIEIINPVEYAAYREYGHRTPNHKGWVRGAFMMTISAKELETMAPAILQRNLETFMREHFT